ncbi:MAG: biopolymer transporter ExbD [Flavobacteriales bacterium]|jgi:biopolymer transport protein ExbD|nr:biopolymer transporter ExbD [Flavobacteriales bacterium]MBK6894926.1 biopolymer transporter ExbD [Flavobacteriales bacterium]MBK7247155.1 biopolymer transporter ExbD [Flavobacteriales bacterium]MBK9060239.1 biopolymer transporter ExbD [Flavobacteriales bacterium]MBK9598892.1 biopolymer transporter ExbD [Flavobacteriales bacterium]
MADVQQGDGGGGARHQKKRAKKGSTHIDMTPMVDLAFLLLTFFILTTTMYKPSTLQLTFPVPPDEKDKPELDKVNNALTLFLTKEDQILYYKDAFKPGETQLTRTDFSKITPLLIDWNKTTFDRIQELGRKLNANEINETAYDSLKNLAQKEKEALFVIIKPDKDAKYRNMIDMVDDMAIAGIGKYAVQDTIKPAEETVLDAEKLKF